MGEYSPSKSGEYPRIFPNFQNCARCVKDLKDNKDNSLHLARKYARIFVLGHYLFRVANSFPRATLRGTDNVRGQISYHIFAPNGGYCLYIFAPNGGYCLYKLLNEIPKLIQFLIIVKITVHNSHGNGRASMINAPINVKLLKGRGEGRVAGRPGIGGGFELRSVFCSNAQPQGSHPG